VISKRAALVFAAVALIVGMLLSLALRPPGGGGTVVATTSDEGVPVRIHWRVPLSAPRNLPVPPYTITAENKLIIGKEQPEGGQGGKTA